MSEIKMIEPSDRFPFSHGTVYNGVVYVSGQVGFISGTAQVVSDGIRGQCQQTFRNIDDVLSAAGTDKGRIIRCGVYLKDIEQDFSIFNECYENWLGDHRPARSAVQASFALPRILVEVDCIAYDGYEDYWGDWWYYHSWDVYDYDILIFDPPETAAQVESPFAYVYWG